MPFEESNNPEEGNLPLAGIQPTARVIRDVSVGCREPRRDRVLAPFSSVVQTRPGGQFED